MKIVVVEVVSVVSTGGVILVKGNAIPPIGSRVNLFRRPYPEVKEILMWPSESTLKDLQITETNIEAVVFVR